MYDSPNSRSLGMLLLVVASFWACRQNEPLPVSAGNTPATTVTASIPEALATTHTDTVYQYEYRTGSKGEYTYNYDVIGADNTGEPITGNVNMKGKHGTGYLLDKAGKKIAITLEWVGYGELIAEDGQGNVWELGVE